MDSLIRWKEFFNIFRKDITISKTSEKIQTNIAINIENNSSEEQKITSELQTEAALQQQEDITNCFNEVFETPRFDLIDIIRDNLDNEVKDMNKDTKECLKEFDEILQEVNMDISNDEYVSLDEIDDVINNANEEDNFIQEYLELEKPRIGLQESIPYLRGENSNDTFESNHLDTIYESNDFKETNELNCLDKNKTSEKYNRLIEINASKEKPDIISRSSENSDELDENKVKPKDKENINSNELSILTDKVKEINDEVIKEVISRDDSDDCGYHSSDFEFITEEEAKLNGLIINIKPNKPKEKVNKRKRSKKVKTIEIDIDKFSGQRDTKRPNRNSHNPGPNKLQTEVPKWNNFGSEQRENPKWNNLSPGPGNKPITWPEIGNSHSGLNKVPANGPKLNHVSSGPSNIQNGFGSSLRSFRKPFHKNNIGPGFSNLNITGKHSERVDQSAHTQMNNLEPGNMENGSTPKIVQGGNDAGPPKNGFGTSLRSFTKTFHIGPDTSNLNITGEHSETVDQSAHTEMYNPEPGYMQNGSTPKIVQDGNDAGPTILINCTERSNSLQINYPGTNMEQNGPDSNISQRDDNETSEVEKWRTFQYRNQLNVQQFVPDQSYRQNHRVCVGQEYYNLFHPNFGPLPNRSSIRFLENKSTMSDPMPMEYQGIGNNMNMLRQMDENESDEVKKEADECARRIFEMFPEENRTRRRRY